MEKKTNSFGIKLIGIIISTIIFVYLIKYVFLWPPNLASVLEYVKEPLQQSKSWQIVALFVAFVIALLLYKLKEKLIGAFGLLELFGGFWTISTTFSKNFENTLLYALALGSGIFLLIKGIEDMLKQSKSKELDNGA
ncbi:hypothetical protein [Flavobacterium sp. 102]|uniref:hypothetical protein n=1 Tax=Flavobacterium sp. 102 TaxID=2135623 RepID=UPI000EAC1E13|nr:hypothetical protein [Flavobacterium sp. 102]RKS02866.1 hypothetical protein C8C84_2596 [Flavobacterium sp. 102]